MISRLPGLSLPERVWNTARRWAVAWWRILYLGAVGWGRQDEVVKLPMEWANWA